MAELHLTVDTQVIMICNGMSDIVRTPVHEELKALFVKESFLALDIGNQIKTEYDRKMGAESEGRKWLANLAVHDRIRMFELAKLPKQATVKLQEEHFHSRGDLKFVRLAVATESKRLVAEEADYSKAVCKVLKKYAGVIVQTAREACDFIAAHREPAPPESNDE